MKIFCSLRRNSGLRLVAPLAAFLLGSAAHQASAVVQVFHSPADDGVAASDLTVSGPGVFTLHLYMQTGSTASTSAPCDAGNGDEVCQWLVRGTREGSLSFQSFLPVGEVKWRLDEASFAATGGDFEFGQLGVFKLGDLMVAADGFGSLALSGEAAVADLSLSVIEGDASLFSVKVPALTIVGRVLAAGAILLAGVAALRCVRWVQKSPAPKPA